MAVCYCCEWNDARFMLFRTTTNIVSSSSSNNIDDDDIEKIQFATKIEIEREQSRDQLKLPCVERTTAHKFDCLRHISIFFMFYFASLVYEREASARYTNMKKYLFIKIDLWKWFCCFFSFKNGKNVCAGSQ